MRVATIASGSRGNSVFIEGGDTRILVDIGVSATRIGRRLAELDVLPESISAVVVSHEHRDHTAGVGVAARRWGWPVYMNDATRARCSALLSGEEDMRSFSSCRTLRIGGLEVHPFLTCHDAADPLALTVREVATDQKVGVATDLGRATTPVRQALAGCNLLVVEANHDELMLREGPYPWSVKQRIGGSRGHLSNRLAAELAAELVHGDLTDILLAHLSHECNDPGLARDVMTRRLSQSGFSGSVEVAPADDVSEVYEVGDRLARARARERPQLELSL
jgi:phosphoribosyl 1,2-cyclic phosphodiesterase